LDGIPSDGDESSCERANLMKKKEAKGDATDKQEYRPYRVRLPGFINDQDVGLGDVIKRATLAVGIEPCGGCARRAAMLNRWMIFSGKPWK
jgi:hypothetical protein